MQQKNENENENDNKNESINLGSQNNNPKSILKKNNLENNLENKKIKKKIRFADDNGKKLAEIYVVENCKKYNSDITKNIYLYPYPKEYLDDAKFFRNLSILSFVFTGVILAVGGVIGASTGFFIGVGAVGLGASGACLAGNIYKKNQSKKSWGEKIISESSENISKSTKYT